VLVPPLAPPRHRCGPLEATVPWLINTASGGDHIGRPAALVYQSRKAAAEPDLLPPRDRLTLGAASHKVNWGVMQSLTMTPRRPGWCAEA